MAETVPEQYKHIFPIKPVNYLDLSFLDSHESISVRDGLADRFLYLRRFNGLKRRVWGSFDQATACLALHPIMTSIAQARDILDQLGLDRIHFDTSSYLIINAPAYRPLDNQPLGYVSLLVGMAINSQIPPQQLRTSLALNAVSLVEA